MTSFDPGASFMAETCTGCGICSSVCPVSAVVTDQEGMVVSFLGTCIRCGHCGAYCPNDCYGLPPVTDAENSSLEGRIDALFRNRRSVRSYLEEPLDEAALASILEPVGLSPTGHNDQGLRVRVISGRKAVEDRLVRPLVRLLKIADCLGLVSLFAGPARPMVKRLKRGEDLITWGAPCVLLFSAPLGNVTGGTDAVIAASMVAVKAEAAGIGTLWNGVVRIFAPLLGLGRCSAALCAGHPRLRKFQRVQERDWKRIDL